MGTTYSSFFKHSGSGLQAIDTDVKQKFCCINRFNDDKTVLQFAYALHNIYRFSTPLPYITAISARRRLTNKSWLLTEPHASHAMRATRRLPLVQAENNQ
jgi:hypothetical protein